MQWPYLQKLFEIICEKVVGINKPILQLAISTIIINILIINFNIIVIILVIIFIFRINIIIIIDIIILIMQVIYKLSL
jgi:hypothetical protein